VPLWAASLQCKEYDIHSRSRKKEKFDCEDFSPKNKIKIINKKIFFLLKKKKKKKKL
jgi:hypothetical protein